MAENNDKGDKAVGEAEDSEKEIAESQNAMNNTFDSVAAATGAPPAPPLPNSGIPQLFLQPPSNEKETGAKNKRGSRGDGEKSSNASSKSIRSSNKSPAPSSFPTTESGAPMSTPEAKKRFEQYVLKLDHYGGSLIEDGVPASVQVAAAVNFLKYYEKFQRAEQRLYHMLRQQKKAYAYVPLKAAAIYQGYARVRDKAIELTQRADQEGTGSLTPRTQNAARIVDERNATSSVGVDWRGRPPPRAPTANLTVGDQIRAQANSNPRPLAHPMSHASLPLRDRISVQPAPLSLPANTAGPVNTNHGARTVLVDPNQGYYLALPAPWCVVPDIAAKEADVMRLVDSQSDRLRFLGNSTDYAAWRRRFIDLVHRKGIPAGQKAVALEACLSPTAIVLQGFCKLLSANPQAYSTVVGKLEQAYGGEERTVKACLTMVQQLPKLTEGDFGQLSFADATLTEVYSLLATFGRTHEIDAMGVHNTMVSKMDKALRMQYFRHCTFNHLQQGTGVLASWLTSELESLQRDPTVTLTNTRADAQVHATQEVLASEHQCPLCKVEHLLRECPLYTAMSVAERRNFIQRDKRCYRCLRVGHQIRTCKSATKCRVPGCTRDHHTTLHRFNPSGGGSVEKAVAHLTLVDPDAEAAPAECFSDGEDQPIEHVNAIQSESNNSVVLPYAAVYLKSATGPRVAAYALLDACATASFMTKGLAKCLNLIGSPTTLTLHTANGSKQINAYRASLSLFSIANKPFVVTVYVVDSSFMQGKLPAMDSEQLARWPHLTSVHAQQHSQSVPLIPSILLGSDHAHLFHPTETRQHNDEKAPCAFYCKLGWVVYGNGLGGANPQQTLNVVKVSSVQNHLQPILIDGQQASTDFLRAWDLPEGPPQPTIAERYAISRLTEGWQLDDHHRLTLPVLWRPGEPTFLRSNYSLARSRLINNEKKAAWNTADVKAAYKQIIGDYLDKGYAREVAPSERALGKYYLAHFPVIRLDHESTKVRIVMDASAKHDGKCLNDAILPGPSLIGNLVTVLLRFRKHAVAVSGDVSQMFLRIQMPLADRPFHRWLYREEPTQPTREFEMCSHVFGNAGSPCVAMFAAQENACRYFGQSPEFQDCSVFLHYHGRHPLFYSGYILGD